MTETTEKESPAAASPNLGLADDDRRVVAFYEGLLPFRGSPSIHLGFWDGTTGSHREAVANMNRVLAGWVGLQAGERVLDAGRGFGCGAVWLAEEMGVQVTGINIVPAQIYGARRLAHRRGLSHLISFEHRDFTLTGFLDESFDVVWVVESICHTPEKQSFMDEARRQALGRRPVPNAVSSRR